MSLPISSLPPGLSFLRPAYRPTDDEIDEYAHVIANAEGVSDESEALRLYREAELQLWLWRAENRLRTPQPKRTREGRPTGRAIARTIMRARKPDL